MSRRTNGAGAIVTVPPHADFVAEVADHPFVRGLRLNTVMPLRGTPGEALARLAAHGQPLWIDLKGRQLRVAQPAVPPFTEVLLSHPIEVETPTVALFGNGQEPVRVLAVDGRRLILEDGPRRILGPGESVNIPDASLRIAGTLTPRDRDYVAAARALGLHDYMLSFVEQPADMDELQALDPEARIVAKIESRRGLAFAREHAGRDGGRPAGADAAGVSGGPRLCAARGDLYLELERPHHLLRALRELQAADPHAWVASRLLDSLAWDDEPAAQDLTDVGYLLALGYRTFMLGDEVCLRRDSVIAALNALEAVCQGEEAR